MSMKDPSRPRLFIGSSSEALDYAGAFQSALEAATQPQIWDQDVFEPNSTALQTLLEIASTFSFALLILTPDDVTTSRDAIGPSPRDNVVFELGLFLGALGPQRVFFAFEVNSQIKIPSDLKGITAVTWRDQPDGTVAAAIGPAARKIRNAVQAVGPLTAPASPSTRADLVRAAVSEIASVGNGAAGLRVALGDPQRHHGWVDNVLAMALEHFVTRADDVYVAWLRPSEEHPNELRLFRGRALPEEYQHHAFVRGEGLAGQVWASGMSAATSSLQTHPWWTMRGGCENQAYLCVSVGSAGGLGGVLSVGSDSGFEVADGDLSVLELFGSLLGLSISAVPPETAIYRRRMELFAQQLDGQPSAEPADESTRRLVAAVAQGVSDLRPRDELLRVAATEAVNQPNITVGGLRAVVTQVSLSLES